MKPPQRASLERPTALSQRQPIREHWGAFSLPSVQPVVMVNLAYLRYRRSFSITGPRATRKWYMLDHKRVAVLTRYHFRSEKIEDLVESLKGGLNYDLYTAPNIGEGAITIEGVPSVPYSLARYNDLGFSAGANYAVLHLSDLLYAIIRRDLPGYDFYLVVDYDVEFIRSGRDFLDGIAEYLTAEGDGPTDLLGTSVGQRWADWAWNACAAASYSQVVGVFSTFMAMSGRAIDHLLEARRREYADKRRMEPRLAPGDPDNLIHCEAFIASELAAAGFKLVDLARVRPGCYKPELFTIGLPKLMHEPVTTDEAIEMIHPVYSAREFLARRWASAQDGRDAAEGFIAELDRLSDRLPVPLRADYQAQARARLAEYSAL